MAENKSVVIIEADENSVTEQIIAEIYDAVSKRLAVILNLNYLENIYKEVVGCQKAKRLHQK